MRNAEPIELVECGVVGFDRFVGGFESEGWHGVNFRRFFNWVGNNDRYSLRLLSLVVGRFIARPTRNELRYYKHVMNCKIQVCRWAG